MLEGVTAVQEEKTLREPCRGNGRDATIRCCPLLPSSPTTLSEFHTHQARPVSGPAFSLLPLKCLAPDLHVMILHQSFLAISKLDSLTSPWYC